jgi:hypothetical protein
MYGGYTAFLYDYPSIYVSPKIRYVHPPRHTYGYYCANKIIDLFLLKALPKYKKILIRDAKTITEKSNFSFINIKDKIFLVLSRDSIQAVVQELSASGELGPMFTHFADFINDTVIKIDVTSENKEPENTEEAEADDDLMKLRTKVLDTIREYKPFSYLTSSENGSFIPIFIQQTPGKVHTLSAEDKATARSIADRLDICFDPDSDKILSLKSGKLDYNKIAEFMSGNENIHYRVETDQKTRPFSICILCDESGSMSSDRKIEKQFKLVNILYEAFSHILPQDRIWIYGHSGSESPHIYVYQDAYNHTFKETILAMLKRCTAQNYDGPVINAIYEKIRQRTDDNILFLVMSDGYPAGYGYGGLTAVKELTKHIEKCKRDNFVIGGIGFGYDGVKDLYNYYTIVTQRNKKNMISNVSMLLNRMVQAEFK